MLIQRVGAKQALAPKLSRSTNNASKKLNQLKFTLNHNRFVADKINKAYDVRMSGMGNVYEVFSCDGNNTSIVGCPF